MNNAEKQTSLRSDTAYELWRAGSVVPARRRSKSEPAAWALLGGFKPPKRKQSERIVEALRGR